MVVNIPRVLYVCVYTLVSRKVREFTLDSALKSCLEFIYVTPRLIRVKYLPTQLVFGLNVNYLKRLVQTSTWMYVI